MASGLSRTKHGEDTHTERSILTVDLVVVVVVVKGAEIHPTVSVSSCPGFAAKNL